LIAGAQTLAAVEAVRIRLIGNLRQPQTLVTKVRPNTVGKAWSPSLAPALVPAPKSAPVSG